MVFTMVCILQAKSDRAELVRDRLVEAAEVFSRDPETITWSVQQDLSDPTQFVIVERYASRESEKKYHQGNPLFRPTIEFLAKNLAKPFEVVTKQE